MQFLEATSMMQWSFSANGQTYLIRLWQIDQDHFHVLRVVKEADLEHVSTHDTFGDAFAAIEALEA